MKILLIDDEKDFTDLISSLLAFHDHKVDCINDPLKVETALARQPYALIVTDIMMPNLNGFDLIAKIRALEAYRSVPIVVLSAKSLEDEDRKFLLRHGVHFVMKPFEPIGLVDQINQLLAEPS
jgi:DNA-binding response OmpR family regulator